MRGRGGGWVLAQFVLMAAIVAAAFLPPGWPAAVRLPLVVAGGALALAGAGLVVWAGRTLGPAFTPYPQPPDGASLVVRGPYRVVRHPVYASGLVLFTGIALATSVAALLVTGGLALLWALKSRVEERHLLRLFPAYAAYSAEVPWRLLPGIY